MGARRRARELAFLALYQSDLLGEPAAARLHDIVGEAARPPDVVEFAAHIVQSFDRHHAAVDRAIRESSPRWDLERMTATDRAVLRLAVVELLFMPGVPEPVTINEAVEVAKRYGGEESGHFVNAVVDAVRRRAIERAQDPGAEEPAAEAGGATAASLGSATGATAATDGAAGADATARADAADAADAAGGP